VEYFRPKGYLGTFLKGLKIPTNNVREQQVFGQDSIHVLPDAFLLHRNAGVLLHVQMFIKNT
jgi:hypothetical protein